MPGCAIAGVQNTWSDNSPKWQWHDVNFTLVLVTSTQLNNYITAPKSNVREGKQTPDAKFIIQYMNSSISMNSCLRGFWCLHCWTTKLFIIHNIITNWAWASSLPSLQLLKIRFFLNRCPIPLLVGGPTATNAVPSSRSPPNSRTLWVQNLPLPPHPAWPLLILEVTPVWFLVQPFTPLTPPILLSHKVFKSIFKALNSFLPNLLLLPFLVVICPAFPIQGVTHLCDQCAFATADIDVLLQHYESCHTLINLKGAHPHVKAEDEAGGEKEGGRGGEREYSCTKCQFTTEVEEEIFRHYRWEKERWTSANKGYEKRHQKCALHSTCKSI